MKTAGYIIEHTTDSNIANHFGSFKGCRFFQLFTVQQQSATQHQNNANQHHVGPVNTWLFEPDAGAS